MPVRKLTIAFIAAFCALPAMAHDSGDTEIIWPNGAKGALALTYDDAMISQLENAVPVLDKYGLKATFYLTLSNPGFYDHSITWASLAQDGHELGNHSIFHACAVAPGETKTKDRDLNDYNAARMVKELKTANDLLGSVDGRSTRTFAYPCGHMEIDGESFVDDIRHLFKAARGVTGPPSTAGQDPMRVTAFSATDKTSAQLIAYAKTVKKSGGYGTVIFHGVGDEYLKVSLKDHARFLKYLNDNSDDIWVDTLENISNHVAAQN